MQMKNKCSPLLYPRTKNNLKVNLTLVSIDGITHLDKLNDLAPDYERSEWNLELIKSHGSEPVPEEFEGVCGRYDLIRRRSTKFSRVPSTAEVFDSLNDKINSTELTQGSSDQARVAHSKHHSNSK